MALNKTIITRFGADATYHRVAHFDITKDHTIFSLWSYTNSEDRTNGALPLHKEKYVFPEIIEDEEVNPFTFEAMDTEGNNPFKIAYDYIKTLPEFENAEDC